MPTSPKLVIFDCDGVLVETESVFDTLFAEELASFGIKIGKAEVRERYIGGTIAKLAERLTADGLTLGPNWVERFYERLFDRLRQGVETIPGVVSVIDQLDAAGIARAIGSNGPMDKMQITLRPNGLWERFEGRIFSAHDLGLDKAKPHPGLYLDVAKTMDATPDETCVIEDSKTGAAAARAAGMRCLGYTADTPEADLVAQGAEPFSDMLQVPGLLGL